MSIGDCDTHFFIEHSMIDALYIDGSRIRECKCWFVKSAMVRLKSED